MSYWASGNLTGIVLPSEGCPCGLTDSFRLTRQECRAPRVRGPSTSVLQILGLPDFRGVTLQDVQKMVAEDNKQRFALTCAALRFPKPIA